MNDNIGDVNSNVVGSGARMHGGKPRYDLLPLKIIQRSLPPHIKDKIECRVLHWLGKLQENPQEKAEQERGWEALQWLVMNDPLKWWNYTTQVMEYGSKKYAPWNWAKGMPWSVVIGCVARHAMKIIDLETKNTTDPEEQLDAESGLPHRAHMICNLMFLLYYIEHYPQGNDLFDRNSLETA